MSHDHGGRCAGDARHAMVLGEPEAAIAQPLGVAGEIERIAQCLRGVAALDDGREIEY